MILDSIEQLRRQPLPVRQRATAMITFVAVAVITFVWFILFFSNFVLNDILKPVPEPVKVDEPTGSGFVPPFSR
jgi:hypothetical protein